MNNDARISVLRDIGRLLAARNKHQNVNEIMDDVRLAVAIMKAVNERSPGSISLPRELISAAPEDDRKVVDLEKE